MALCVRIEGHCPGDMATALRARVRTRCAFRRPGQRPLAVELSPAEVRDSNFFGVPIKHAYIITSKSKNAVAAK